MFTLDLARAHIRELQQAAERSHTRQTVPSNPSRLRRLSDLVARNR